MSEPLVRAAPPAADPVLDRVFSLVAFDWDGTAVPDRAADATTLGAAMDRLLRAGAQLAVLTGTRFANVDGALAGAIRGPHVARLLVSANRGSELYGYDASGEPVLLHRRVATGREEAALDAIADGLAAELIAATKLDVAVIRDRLNRRKIDLFPSWSDPPKARIAELVEAVETRLATSGWRGGIGAIVRRTRMRAEAAGLADARITSDGKHVEVGLTDKADAIDAILAWTGERAAHVLLVGDEVGTVSGVVGSDFRMATAGARGATFVSVGPEPEGVPAGVLHLPGGPERFVQLLVAQADRRAAVGADASAGPAPAVVPTEDPTRRLVEDGLQLVREHEIESCFAVGNGAAGVRGSLSEGTPLSAPATRIAGAWTRAAGLPAIARAPEWTGLHVQVGDVAIEIDEGAPEHRRELDLAQGILWRTWRHSDAEGRATELRVARFASLADRRLLAERLEVHTVNWSGELRLELRVAVPSEWRREGALAWTGPGAAAVAASLRGDGEGGEVPAADPVDPQVTPPPLRAEEPLPPREAVEPPIGMEPEERLAWRVLTRPGATWRLDRVCAVSRRPRGDLTEVATTALGDLDRVVADHAAACRVRAAACTPVLEGDATLRRALAFAGHHLVAAANPEDDHVSVGARGLTGPGYMGHVFWDAELWLLPVYALTWPRAARALITYRWHTLPAARARAADAGWRGALYAWESAGTGEDVTPPAVRMPDGRMVPVRTGLDEHHISGDVAWAAWHYAAWTGDDRWLRDMGAEIILETARFWASRGRVEADGRFHIRHVIGPDEYHEDVDDDAYTNGLAAWNLRCGARVARLLARRWPSRFEELAASLGLDHDEPRHWEALAAGTWDGFDAKTGVIEQFAGYFDREDIDLRALEPRTAPVDVLLGHARVQGSQLLKQPDVLLLLHLFPDQYAPEVHRACWAYYDARTAHGSSLSPPIHALAAARVGDLDAAERYLRITAAIDLDDHFGNAAGGVHVGALGGLWQAVVFGLAGLRFTEAGPTLDPRLPACVDRLVIPFTWRERRWRAEVRPGAARLLEET